MLLFINFNKFHDKFNRNLKWLNLIFVFSFSQKILTNSELFDRI